DAGDAACRSDHLCRDERVRAGAAAEVEHALAGGEPSELPGICDSGERLDRGLRHVRELRRIVEVLRPGAPRREDEVSVGLLRHAGVGVLDLRLAAIDVDAGGRLFLAWFHAGKDDRAGAVIAFAAQCNNVVRGSVLSLWM